MRSPVSAGVAQDAQKAAALFKKAAKDGNNEARFHLGIMHLNGHGVKKNVDTAQQHLHEAATVRPLSPLFPLPPSPKKFSQSQQKPGAFMWQT